MLDRRSLLKMSAMAGVVAAFPKVTLGNGVRTADGRSRLHKLCRDIPKAEFHVHLNCIIYPDVALALAEKNGLEALSFSSAEAFYHQPACDPGPCVVRSDELWFNLFTTIDELMGTLKTADDVRFAVMQWIKRSGVSSNLKYAELTVPHPKFHGMAISLDDYFDGLLAAHQEAKSGYGIALNYIGSAFLYESIEDGVEAVKDFARYKDKVPLIGITGFNENVKDITVLAPVYELARELGFRTPMHVGIGEPHAVPRIWDALKKIRIERIDHGYMAALDQNLIDHIAEQQIPMTSCPYKIASGAFQFPEDDSYMSWNWNNFPFKEFYEKGVLISLHSDTPGIGNFTLGEVYMEVVDRYGFDQEDLITLARNSFKGIFGPDSEKARYLADLDTWVQESTALVAS